MSDIDHRIADAADRLFTNGILDEIFDAGYRTGRGEHLPERDASDDAEYIVRVVLNRVEASALFILNAVVMWALCRAAALGDRLAPEPCMAGDGAQAPRASSPASADPMHAWDLEAGEYFSEWSR